MSESLHGPAPDWIGRGDQPITFVASFCGAGANDHAKAAMSALVDELVVVDQFRGDGVVELALELVPEDAWGLMQALRERLPEIDVYLQPRDERGSQLIICDMDMTMITAESLDEAAEMLGLGEEISKITSRAMRGELDFREALAHRIGLLEGQPESVFVEIAEQIKLTQGAELMMQAVRAAGAHSILVSGGFEQVAGAVASRLGFDEYHCNHLEIEDEKLTGKVLEPIVDADFKLALLKRRAEELEIDLADCCAIGDGANDRMMIEAAGVGIAFHGKPVLRQATACQINMTGLQAAIYFNGWEGIR